MAEHGRAGRAEWEAEMFRLLAENVVDYAVFVVDPHRRVLSWSKGAERLLGFSEQEILGKPCDCFFTPEDVRQGVPQREMDEALATGRGEDDRWHLRRDGSRFWSSGVVTPLRDEGGGLRGFAKVMRDRTDLKRAAEAGRERERQLHLLTDRAPVLIALFDTALDAILLADDRGRYVDANPAACTLLGYDREELLQRGVLDVTPPACTAD
jgi:PAS domain S-box-containing protein